MDGERYVIPTLANGSDDIMASASAILAKLNAVPFDQIGLRPDANRQREHHSNREPRRPP